MEKDEQYLEDRGCFIVRALCKYLHTEVVFPMLASIVAVGPSRGSPAELREPPLRRPPGADDERDSPHGVGSRRLLQAASLLLLAHRTEAGGAAAVRRAVGQRGEVSPAFQPGAQTRSRLWLCAGWRRTIKSPAKSSSGWGRGKCR